MRFINQKEAENFSTERARELACQYSNLCFDLAKRNQILEAQVAKLSHEIGLQNQQALFSLEVLQDLQKMKFGRSSEHRPWEGPNLFDEGESKPETETIVRKKRTSFGRRPQLELPVEEVIFELSLEEMQAQGLEKWEGQFEESEVIFYESSTLILQKHKRQKYRQKTEEKIITAPGPAKLKGGCRYSVEFAVNVGVDKYQWHMPLDRQRRKFFDQGCSLSNQVLFDQVETVAWYLKPHVMPLLAKSIEGSPVNIADESPWKNLQRIKDRQRQNYYIWAVTNNQAVVYEVYDARSKAIAQEFLENITGVLLTDGCSVYKCLESKNLKLANDWSHVRRKFLKSEKNYKPESEYFLNKIDALFEIERTLKGKSLKEITQVRQSESKAITQQIQEKMLELGKTLPESSLGKALKYTFKLWKGLTLFLDHPEVPLDSNAIERALRGPVLGRKNHYGSKTLESADIAAVWYSVIQTCLLNNKNPREYILDTIYRILHKKTVDPPWAWTKSSNT